MIKIRVNFSDLHCYIPFLEVPLFWHSSSFYTKIYLYYPLSAKDVLSPPSFVNKGGGVPSMVDFKFLWFCPLLLDFFTLPINFFLGSTLLAFSSDLIPAWIQRVLKLKLIATLNPLSANPTKLSNTLKQFVGKLPTNCLSVLDHFVGLALKGLNW